MTAEVIYKGPQPALGQKWCTVCAFTWKLAANDRHAQEIEDAGKASDGVIVVIDATADEELPPVAPAVAIGIYLPLQQWGPLELCWTHLTAVRLQSTGGLHLPPPGMPGVPGGMGLNGGGRG
jgi:hypothetical protein